MKLPRELLRALAPLVSHRTLVMSILWLLPWLVISTVGLVAIYQSGWTSFLLLTLPFLWLIAFLTSRYWIADSSESNVKVDPLTPGQFWTSEDTGALNIVEEYRRQVVDIDRNAITDPQRYVMDAQNLSTRLAAHYYPTRSMSSGAAYRPLTIVEVLAVIHLSIEDLETWMLENVPGSNRITLGHIAQVPTLARLLDVGQQVLFFATSVTNPSKLLTYPLWRKAGQLTLELQNEVARAFYQRYLRQVSYYLIEMYSGRLQGGSALYRQRFQYTGMAAHEAKGDMELLEQCEAVSTTIAVMGQVKAGKSSLINSLMKDSVARVSLLPETRTVRRYEFDLPGSAARPCALTLLDTPGYSEADCPESQLVEIERAVAAADIVLLVLSAMSPAKEADLKMVRRIENFYVQRPKLKPPPVLAVITHIDQLRPIRQWQPPYEWRQPQSEKEHSIAQAANYVAELFGNRLSGLTCVFTGPDNQSADEVIGLLVRHLEQGRATAVLKAFYRGLSEKRYEQLKRQVVGLFKSMVGH